MFLRFDSDFILFVFYFSYLLTFVGYWIDFFSIWWFLKEPFTEENVYWWKCAVNVARYYILVFIWCKFSCGSLTSAKITWRISLGENHSGFALRKIIIIFLISTSFISFNVRFTRQARHNEKLKSPLVAIWLSVVASLLW